jgi:hypothetical protein
MDLLKAMGLAALLTGCVALVIGSQGTSAGSLAIHPMTVGEFRVYWSWPLFLIASSLSWAIMLLQR